MVCILTSIYFDNKLRRVFVSELRYQLIADKIRELNDEEYTEVRKEHTVDIVLSDFEFEIQQHLTRKSNYTEFYLLAISHETEVFVTKALPPNNGRLVFPDTFSFKNIHGNFAMKVQIYSIKLKTEKSRMDILLKKVRLFESIYFNNRPRIDYYN